MLSDLNRFELLALLVVAIWLVFMLGLTIYQRLSCRFYGPNHPWQSPAFRVRECPHCHRREVLTRTWEFDGYVQSR